MGDIIYCGVDFHARQQTICCLKTETGELLRDRAFAHSREPLSEPPQGGRLWRL